MSWELAASSGRMGCNEMKKHFLSKHICDVGNDVSDRQVVDFEEDLIVWRIMMDIARVRDQDLYRGMDPSLT